MQTLQSYIYKKQYMPKDGQNTEPTETNSPVEGLCLTTEVAGKGTATAVLHPLCRLDIHHSTDFTKHTQFLCSWHLAFFSVITKRKAKSHKEESLG